MNVQTDNNLESFYKDAGDIISALIDENYISQKALKFIRGNLDKSILNKYFYIGDLSNEQVELLGAETSKIKFSMDSMIKNRIKHSELNLHDYSKIDNILRNPDKITSSKSQKNSILILKYNDKYYQVVIKTTRDKKENYLTSFRLMEEKEFNKY